MSPRTKRRLFLALAIVCCALLAAFAFGMLVVITGVTLS